MKAVGNLTYIVGLSALLLACSNDTEEMKTNATESATAVLEESVSAPIVEQATPDREAATSNPVTAPVVAETPAVVAVPAADAVSDAAVGAVNSSPQEHIIKGVITQWQPLVTYAQVGDSVKFTGMTGHDTASMEGMIPDGATPWHSKLGEEGYTVVLEKEGAYVYKCTPHITTGMVGIIVVGDKSAVDLAKLEENAGNVKIGGNMVKRAIRKLKTQLGS